MIKSKGWNWKQWLTGTGIDTTFLVLDLFLGPCIKVTDATEPRGQHLAQVLFTLTIWVFSFFGIFAQKSWDSVILSTDSEFESLIVWAGSKEWLSKLMSEGNSLSLLLNKGLCTESCELGDWITQPGLGVVWLWGWSIGPVLVLAGGGQLDIGWAIVCSRSINSNIRKQKINWES